MPGFLVVSRSVYDNVSANVQPGAILPPNCAKTTGGCGAASGAPNDGTYPTVWNNDRYDGSFGITSRIFLDQITPAGGVVSTLEVPNSLQKGFAHDQLVTSFSSKSELGLHLSLDGRYLTFMGYVAPVNTVDVSNSNTQLAVDTTNPDGQNFYRAIARVDRHGHFRFTETNAYSGNNGRAAILNNRDGREIYYTSGNAGNGANPQPDNVILGAARSSSTARSITKRSRIRRADAARELLGHGTRREGRQDRQGRQLPRHRGATTSCTTKGSGGNGVNTVYFVDTTGTACPSGVGVPSPKAVLPTAPLAYNAATLQTAGLPNNMCVLAGFPSTPNKTATTLAYPFGIWFADANTLYVADEGDGYTGGADLYMPLRRRRRACRSGFDAGTKQWKLAYTLQNGLNLGQPYSVAGYPAGNIGHGLPWAPATAGLRNLTGRVERDGTVTIWAITSTVSGNGDVGADPNRLVAVRDVLKNTSAATAAHEQFAVLRTAKFAEVLRVSSSRRGRRRGGRTEVGGPG